jgi:hypothetical protein
MTFRLHKHRQRDRQIDEQTERRDDYKCYAVMTTRLKKRVNAIDIPLLHLKVMLSTFELKSENCYTSFLALQLLSTLFQIRDI